MLANVWILTTNVTMMTSSNGNIFRVTGLVCGEFWCFLYLRLNIRLNNQLQGWWFETPSGSLWRHLNEKTVSIKGKYLPTETPTPKVKIMMLIYQRAFAFVDVYLSVSKSSMNNMGKLMIQNNISKTHHKKCKKSVHALDFKIRRFSRSRRFRHECHRRSLSFW